MRVFQTSVLISSLALAAASAGAQDAPQAIGDLATVSTVPDIPTGAEEPIPFVPVVDYDTLLASCEADGATCVEKLQAALEVIKAAGLSVADLEASLGALTTVAVAAAASIAEATAIADPAALAAAARAAAAATLAEAKAAAAEKAVADAIVANDAAALATANAAAALAAEENRIAAAAAVDAAASAAQAREVARVAALANPVTASVTAALANVVSSISQSYSEETRPDLTEIIAAVETGNAGSVNLGSVAGSQN